MKPQNTPVLDDHLTWSTGQKGYYSRTIYVTTFVVNGLLGILSAYIRIYFYRVSRPIHWEAVVSLIVLIILNIAWLIFVSTTQKNHYFKVYILNTGLIWLGFVVGWTVMSGYFMGELIIINAVGALLGIIVGGIVFYLQKRLFLNKMRKFPKEKF